MKFKNICILSYEEIDSKNSYLVRVRVRDRYVYYYLSQAGFEEIFTKLARCPVTFVDYKYQFTRLAEWRSEVFAQVLESDDKLVTDNLFLDNLKGLFRWEVGKFTPLEEIEFQDVLVDIRHGIVARANEEFAINNLHLCFQQLKVMVVNLVEVLTDLNTYNHHLFITLGYPVVGMLGMASLYLAIENAFYGENFQTFESENLFMTFTALAGLGEAITRLLTQNRFGFFTLFADRIQRASDILVALEEEVAVVAVGRP